MFSVLPPKDTRFRKIGHSFVAGEKCRAFMSVSPQVPVHRSTPHGKQIRRVGGLCTDAIEVRDEEG